MLVIEQLAAQHRRESFDCGDVALNEFLQRQAGQLARRSFAQTYIARSGDDHSQVAGFITLSNAQVQTRQLPFELKLPRHPVPALRIGRLAVDLRQQGHGVGQQLVSFALRLALDMSQKVGLHSVLVDAKHDRALAFYVALGFKPTLDDPLSLYLPLSTLKKISAP